MLGEADGSHDSGTRCQCNAMVRKPEHDFDHFCRKLFEFSGRHCTAVRDQQHL